MSTLQQALAEALNSARWRQQALTDELVAAILATQPMQDWLATHDEDVRRAERERLRDIVRAKGHTSRLTTGDPMQCQVCMGPACRYLDVLLADPEPVVTAHVPPFDSVRQEGQRP